ncbi:MAG: YceI family protein [Pyrinomonadaceae bacterium]
MKRAIFGFCVAVIVAIFLWGTSINAVNQRFEERFVVNGKVDQTGESGTYNFDKAHSFIAFKVRHNGLIEVPGFFRDFTGAVTYDAKDVSKSSVSFTAKATSIDTGVQGRDNHLRTPDFFEVEKFPEITFKSTSIEKKGKGWIMNGDFTMKGVTKSISFPFNVTGFLPGGQRSGPRMGITAGTSINRRDFGVNWGSNIPGTSTPVVSDSVDVILQIEAVQPKAPAATPAE